MDTPNPGIIYTGRRACGMSETALTLRSRSSAESLMPERRWKGGCRECWRTGTLFYKSRIYCTSDRDLKDRRGSHSTSQGFVLDKIT